MKTIRYLFYMILILSNIGVLRGDFSIAPFLNYLQETGYYDIILSVKLYFGDDVAIDICQELVQSNDCESVVRIYMTNPSSNESGPRRSRANNNSEINEKLLNYIIKKLHIKNQNLIELIKLILSFYSDLIEEMKNVEEIIAFIKRITRNRKLIKHLSQLG